MKSLGEKGTANLEVSDPESQRLKELFFESSAGDGTSSSDHYLHGFKLIACLFACYICAFLVQLDQTIILTILETVGNKFHGYNKIGWISAGYLLSCSVFSATWGRLSIIFGRKWSLIAAVIIFEAGSLMCALSSSMNVLIGGRVLAGIGGGGLQTINMIIATEIAPIDKRPMIMASFGITGIVGTVGGPLIGGALANHGLWRWCFYINLPIGGIALGVITLFFHPPSPTTTLREKFVLIDYTGAFLIAAGISLILLGLSSGGNEFTWDSAAIICFFVIGGLSLIAFCIWNFRFSKLPMIPYNLVSSWGVMVPVAATTLCFFCFMGTLTYLTVYFQVIKGKDAWRSGVALLPIIITTILTAFICGIVTKKTRMLKPFSLFGGMCGSIGFGVMSKLTQHSGDNETIGLLILPGVYLGIFFQTMVLSSQLEAPKEPGSTILVTSLVLFFRGLGGAFGSDVCQLVFTNTYKSLIKRALDRGDTYGLTLSEAELMLSRPQLIKNLNVGAKEIVFECFVQSFRDITYLTAGIAAASFILVIFMSNKRIPKKKDIAVYAVENKDQESHGGDHSGKEMSKAA